MPPKNVAFGILALLGGVVGGALSGGLVTVVRSAEAAPGNPPVQPNPVGPNPVGPNPNPSPTPALTADLVPAVLTVPAGGLLFKSSGGKLLAKMYAHEGGALLSVYNAAGMVVASFGVDKELKGGRLALSTPKGGGCFIGLGLEGGGRLDLYHPQEASPRATLGVRDYGHAGYLILRDLTPHDGENELQKKSGTLQNMNAENQKAK